jgi:benzoylformate decarboxylase
MAKTGIHAFLDLLVTAGVNTLFGNPGTTELPLSDALVDDDRIRYILGLQEVPVMAMADGYAMASRGIGVVNLHISCGLGNGMGMLYNAHREGTPLLVTAGQQDRRLKFQEPILWGDMVAVAKPWTKWAAEVDRVEDLPAAVRRAIQMALAPPTGPVFLSIPIDVQMADASHLELDPVQPLDTRTRPSVDAVRAAARVLAAAQRPAILVGSRVQEADAVNELVAVAERLGAPVFSEPPHSHGRLSFPADHPLYAQTIPLWAHEIADRLAEFDVLLVAGTDLLREYVYHGPEPAIPRSLRLVHLDDSPREVGKNFPVEVGVIGNAKSALAEIGALLSDTMTPENQRQATERLSARTRQHALAREKFKAAIAKRSDARPMPGSVLMASLASVLPENAAVIEEAVTTTNTSLQRLAALKNTSGYFGHRGWALGWGLGCSLGVKLAWPDRPVLAVLGEGAAMYGIQGLWSAARYNLAVTFVICNNAQYQILKSGAAGFGLPAATRGEFVGMDLAGPEIDMVALAGALGVPAERVTEPAKLADKVSRSLAAGDGPRLFDVPIERTLAGPG